MPVPSTYTGLQAMLGFSSPSVFYIGYSPNYLYPIRGLGWSMQDNPAFNNMAALTAGGRDIRVPNYLNPLHGFKLVFNFLENDPALDISGNPDTDFRMLYSLYSGLTGNFGDILYQPRNSVVTDQVLSLPDTNGYVELVYAIGPFFNESVQELNGATPTIFKNGTNITSTCTFYAPDTISPYSGIVFTTTDSFIDTDVITANFTFYYRCHFDKGNYSFEEFVYDVLKTGIGLSQVRL